MQPAVLSKPLLTALAGFSLSISGAFAAVVPAPVSGDAFLAFRAAGGAGSDVSYIVDLGPATQFANAAPGTTFTLNTIGNIGADLTAVYGDWSNRADFFWAIFGTNDSQSPTVYATRERTNVNTQSISWTPLTSGARSATRAAILSPINGGFNSYDLLTPTTNSPVGAFQPNSAQSAYYKQVTDGPSDFGSQSEWTSVEGSFLHGASGTVLDFYRIRNATPNVSFLGKFTISAAGVVTFTVPSATPPANTDTDGDGQTDALEAVAGTDPNNGADFFHVQTIEYTGTTNKVSFLTIPNRSYAVEYSEDLTAGSWISVGSPYITTTAGGLVVISDTDAIRAARPKGFYRVKVSQ
jgi:hypothetical protein